MSNLASRERCTSCMACLNVCSHNAISQITDSRGYYYPLVDATKCTDCGLCKKICPIINISSVSTNTPPHLQYLLVGLKTIVIA